MMSLPSIPPEDTREWRLLVAPEDIAALTFVLDGYEGLVLTTTTGAEANQLRLLFSPGQEVLLEQVLLSLDLGLQPESILKTF